MICPHCKRENPDEATYCSYCGLKLDGNSGFEDKQPYSEHYSEEYRPFNEPVPSSAQEQWWQSLGFVIALAVFGHFCCCPIASILAIIFYLTNPHASHQNKVVVTIIIVLLLLAHSGAQYYYKWPTVPRIIPHIPNEGPRLWQ